MKSILLRRLQTCSFLALAGSKLMAGDIEGGATRYGWFNWLDQRSEYGQGVFPEPFLVDDSDLETRELRFDWLHTASASDHTDRATAEIEYGIGLTTLELEAPYERDVAGSQITAGLANISLSARHPLVQYVSPGGLVDFTFSGGLEAGMPTTSEVSHNAELVPKILGDLKLGNLTLQSVLGYSRLFGPGEQGGLDTFEYGFVLGWNIPHRSLPLPGVDRLIPVLELSGETVLNKGSAGQNSLTADIGLRANLKAIGRIQPRPGIVFVFPTDNGSRQQLHWGILTSLVFEF